MVELSISALVWDITTIYKNRLSNNKKNNDEKCALLIILLSVIYYSYESRLEKYIE